MGTGKDFGLGLGRKIGKGNPPCCVKKGMRKFGGGGRFGIPYWKWRQERLSC